MPPFQALAAQLVAEVPIIALERLLEVLDRPDNIAAGGRVCGRDCTGPVGQICGLRCNPPAGAPGVVDRDGRLPMTAADLTAIREDLSQLRKAVLDEFTPYLDRLRADY